MKVFLGLLLMLAPVVGWSQSVPPGTLSSSPPTTVDGKDYKIGPNDLIEVNVFDNPALNGPPARVTASGSLTLTLIGAVQAAGKTARELEQTIVTSVKAQGVKDPHVTVSIREYYSPYAAPQLVSIDGAVRSPNIYPLQTQKYLSEMIIRAGSLTDNAGKNIRVTRRSESGAPEETKVMTISTEDFDEGKPEADIVIQPGDQIIVSRAGTIFIEGEVAKPGEFPLKRGRPISVLAAVALAGNPLRDAKKNKTVIKRCKADKTCEDIKVNLQKVFDGSAPDVMLVENDILLVPASKAKGSITRAMDTAVNIAITRATYGF